MKKASCNHKQNVEEEIKEKLDRSASNERRRCLGSMCDIPKKTRALNVGEEKIQLLKTMDF